MSQQYNLSESKKHQELNAVHRLLEVEQKHITWEEGWQHKAKKQHSRSDQIGLLTHSKTFKRKESSTQKILTVSKNVEKERLRKLMRDNIDNEEEIAPVPAKKQVKKTAEELALTMKFLKNAKLRPFNSNMTFYSSRKEEKNRYISSSMAFYKKETKGNMNGSDNHTSFRFIKDHELDYQKRFSQREKMQQINEIIYFRPNKSQTVRELLNQMKEERAKNREVVLNATERPYNESIEMVPIQIFNQYQTRLMNRYKKFMPFQKDDNLLFRKILDGQNIWLRRYKQSWQRRKNDKEGRKSYFKRLIVKN